MINVENTRTVEDLMQKADYFYIEKDEITGTIILHFEIKPKGSV